MQTWSSRAKCRRWISASAAVYQLRPCQSACAALRRGDQPNWNCARSSMLLTTSAAAPAKHVHVPPADDEVTVYVDVKSPHAYLILQPALRIAADYNVRVEFKPYLLCACTLFIAHAVLTRTGRNVAVCAPTKLRSSALRNIAAVILSRWGSARSDQRMGMPCASHPPRTRIVGLACFMPW